MLKRLLPALVLGLGFGLLATLPSPAAESAATSEKISRLIEQMGSNEFDDREAAQKELDAIGEPALAALKKATTSEDTEVRRRAEELVKDIEQRTESAKLLQPTKIHLVYKDTPLHEAVADFRKKSGFNISLLDPDGKLKDRKVTLDTGDTVFWEAYEKFCAAANLVEAKPEDLVQQVKPGQPGQPGQGGGGPVPQPVPLPPVKPGARQLQNAQPKQAQAFAADEAPPQEVPQKAAKQQPAVKPVVKPQPVAPPVAAPAIIIVPNQQPVQLQPGQIVLKDGKPKDATPADYRTSIRVRAMDKADNLPPGQIGQIVVGLQVSPEPKLTWQNLNSVTITKAIDDNDQTLTQPAVEADNNNNLPGGGFGVRGKIGVVINNGPGWNNGTLAELHQEIPVYLKKGEKKSKSLKELSGVIKAQILGPAQTVITTEDVLKSANKTFQGGDKGSIKIIEATRADNGQVHVRFDMQAPQDVIPVNTAPAPANGPGPQPGLGGAKLQLQQAQVGRALRPIRQQFGVGLQAEDDKGNVIPVQVQQQYVQDQQGGHVEYVAYFQLTKEQQSAKLTYTGSRLVTVEVPFTLKDVTLP